MPDVYRLRVSVLMYKMLIKNELPLLRENISIQTAQHEYDTRSRDQLLTPFPRVESIRMGYQYQFINIWNEVPENIKNATSLKSFKAALSQLFLSFY